MATKLIFAATAGLLAVLLISFFVLPAYPEPTEPPQSCGEADLTGWLKQEFNNLPQMRNNSVKIQSFNFSNMEKDDDSNTCRYNFYLNNGGHFSAIYIALIPKKVIRILVGPLVSVHPKTLIAIHFLRVNESHAGLSSIIRWRCL